MRATFLAGGDAIDRGTVDDVRSIDLAPTAAFLLDVPAPQHSQGIVRRDMLDDGHDYKAISIIGLNDFHGQLDQTAATIDNLAYPVGGAAKLATLFDEEASFLPGQTLLLAAGDNVGASPPNSALLQDIPAIDVENAWGLDATSFGNHEFDFGLERILLHQDRANFPFLSTNIVDEDTGEAPDWMETSKVFRVNGIKVGVLGSTVRTTPELVKAGATEGLEFLDEAQRLRRESRKLRRQGVKVQVVVIHEGATLGANAVDGLPAAEWQGPIVDIVEGLEHTTIDLVIAGHTHRAANTVIAGIPVVEGFNAGASYSVAQLLVKGSDVAWAGATTRVAKNAGVAQRADVKAIVDKANADTAPLRNQVIGTQSIDILRDNPARLKESAMGNLVADAMRAKYPGVEAALTNSGGLRQDIRVTPPSAGEAPGQITWGEVFAVLPFGNRTVIITLTGAQMREAFLNGFSRDLQPVDRHGAHAADLRAEVHVHLQRDHPGRHRDVEGAAGPERAADADQRHGHRPLRHQRLHVHGWRRLHGVHAGTDVLQPGDGLLEVTIEYITANSPVAPVVEGRFTGP